MALLNRKNSSPQQKIGVKKMASVQPQPQSQEQTPQRPQLNLNTGHKTTLVSGIVEQLIKSGYKGDLMSSAGMTYANPDIPETHMINDRENAELTQDMVVEDIDFEKKESNTDEAPKEEPKKLSAAELKKRNAVIFEERAKNSQDQISGVAKNARAMYGHIDEFIGSLREAAQKTDDNPRLQHKLENLRRICIGFVRSVEQQIPNYATSLFVNPEENNNG